MTNADGVYPHETLPVGKTQEDQQRNAELLAGYDYEKYPEALTGLLKTIELILGLPMMNQLDLLATPMSDCFTEEPNFTPYELVPSHIPLDTMNPPVAKLTGSALFWADKSLEMPFEEENEFPEDRELARRSGFLGDPPDTYVVDARPEDQLVTLKCTSTAERARPGRDDLAGEVSGV